jgi:pyridoxine 5'-phosphate synthase PdxJ
LIADALFRGLAGAVVAMKQAMLEARHRSYENSVNRR